MKVDIQSEIEKHKQLESYRENYEKKRTPNQGCPRSPTSMSSEETHSMGGLKMHRSTTKGKDYGSTLWQNQAN